MNLPRWYTVANDGRATLCVDECDARQTAIDADVLYPRGAPHIAVQLAPVRQDTPVESEAIEHLILLVNALDTAFISTWQSTAAWQKELDAARDFLDSRLIEDKP